MFCYLSLSSVERLHCVTSTFQVNLHWYFHCSALENLTVPSRYHACCRASTANVVECKYWGLHDWWKNDPWGPKECWLRYYAVRLDSVNLQWDLKLAIKACLLFPLATTLSAIFLLCPAMVLAWVGAFGQHKCGMNYPVLTEMSVIEWLVAVY